MVSENSLEVPAPAEVKAISTPLKSSLDVYKRQILGTGSNSCFYDGKIVVKNVRAGGYILGDEGRGAVLGLSLIHISFIGKWFFPAGIWVTHVLSNSSW